MNVQIVLCMWIVKGMAERSTPDCRGEDDPAILRRAYAKIPTALREPDQSNRWGRGDLELVVEFGCRGRGILTFFGKGEDALLLRVFSQRKRKPRHRKFMALKQLRGMAMVKIISWDVVRSGSAGQPEVRLRSM